MAAYNSVFVYADRLTGLHWISRTHNYAQCLWFYVVPGQDWFLYRPRFDIVQTNLCCILMCITMQSMYVNIAKS